MPSNIIRDVIVSADGGGSFVTSMASLSALDPTNGDGIALTVEGRSGAFVFDSSDLSSEVTSDTLQGVYIAPSFDATGAGGAWVRQHENTLHVEHFGAGEASNDSPAFLAMLEFAAQGMTLEASSGQYNCDDEIDYAFGRDQDGVNINWTGSFIFQSTNGINLRDLQSSTIKTGHIAYLQTVIDDGIASAGDGITLTSLWSCDVDIQATSNFLVGTKLIGGDLSAVSGNGMAFNDVHVRNAKAPITTGGIGILVTTIPVSTNPGYFNENKIRAGFLRAEKGLVFVKGSLQVDPFNGNKIHEPQIENVEEVGIELEYCSSNTIEHPRFEGSSVPNLYWIHEKSDCSRNDYYITGPVDFSKMLLEGILYNWFGRLNDGSGGLVANQLFGGDNSAGDNNSHDISLGIRLTANSPDNTVAFGGIPGNTRWLRYAGIVRDGAGDDRVFGLLDPHGHLSITGASGVTVVPSGTSTITTSTTGASDVTLQMSEDREINGMSIMMDLTFYTNQIEIAKSTGTVTISFGSIAATGLYMLIYRSDAWKFSRIGDKLA